jgi:threonine dehydrogenase-like Zn-dependent dehydrogenase
VTERLRLAFADGSFSVRRDEQPEVTGLAPEQVLVEVEAAAVAAPELARASGAGHPDPGIAVVGIVTRAGRGADHLVGARVVCGPTSPCGDCARCRRGRPELCATRCPAGADGGESLASHVIAGARWICPLGEPIAIEGPEAALLGREATLAYTLYARGNLAPGARAVVLGHGAVARFCLEILAAQGIRPIAIAPTAGGDAWVEVATRAGAELLRIDAEPDLEQLRERLAASAPEGSVSELPEAIIETSGEAAARALAVDLSCPGSVAILAGRGMTGTRDLAPAEPAVLDRAADAGVSVLGVAGPQPDLVPEVAALAAKGELDLQGAAAIAPIAELAALLDQLASGALAGRAGVALWRPA